MEWVASTLTLPRKVVYPALLMLMRTPRLPAVDSTDSPAYINGLVRFGERRNLVSARVPSGFKRAIPLILFVGFYLFFSPTNEMYFMFQNFLHYRLFNPIVMYIDSFLSLTMFTALTRTMKVSSQAVIVP